MGYGVCLNDSCQNALENTLHSFQPIIRSVIGTPNVEEKFIEDRDGVIRSNRQAVALMPKDIDQRIVIIFADTISQKNSNNELQSAIDALLKLGAVEQNIIVLSMIASSKACISLIDRFERINIWSASIDKLTNSSKLIPGIGRFENRYKISSKKKKKKKDTKKRRSSSSLTQSPSQILDNDKNKQTPSEDKTESVVNDDDMQKPENESVDELSAIEKLPASNGIE